MTSQSLILTKFGDQRSSQNLISRKMGESVHKSKC